MSTSGEAGQTDADIHAQIPVLLREDRDAVAILTLNRSERLNAWGEDMAVALVDELERIRTDPAIRVCLLTGAGDRAFSSGADMSKPGTHSGATAGQALQDLSEGTLTFFFDVVAFPKPIVCAVNGYAIGAGFLLALCCDVIVAASNAQFSIPQVKLGFIPSSGGLTRLALWVGKGRAFEIAATGRRVGADEAYRIGLAARVCGPAELPETAFEVAQEFAALPPLAVAAAKETLTTSLERSLIQPNAIADVYRSIALRSTKDSAEAHAAWREKRDGSFGGT